MAKTAQIDHVFKTDKSQEVMFTFIGPDKDEYVATILVNRADGTDIDPAITRSLRRGVFAMSEGSISTMDMVNRLNAHA